MWHNVSEVVAAPLAYFPTLPQAKLFIYNPGDIHRRYDPK
jgi:hypothetical protein